MLWKSEVKIKFNLEYAGKKYMITLKLQWKNLKSEFDKHVTLHVNLKQ